MLYSIAIGLSGIARIKRLPCEWNIRGTLNWYGGVSPILNGSVARGVSLADGA